MCPPMYVLFLLCALTPNFSGATSSYTVKPLKLGVEIEGLDLQTRMNDSELFEKIKSYSHEHRLVLIRNQGQIPADTLIAMFAPFGRAFRTPYTTQARWNHEKSPDPAIMRISNDPQEGFKGVGISGWHIDGAYLPDPYAFLVFNSIEAPAVGATKFVGHREVLTSMSMSWLKRMDRLSVVTTRKVNGQAVFETHPLLYQHPVVNETVFCLHLGYMQGIIDDCEGNQIVLNSREQSEFRGRMTNEIEKDDERLVYEHQWKEGDLIIIDNLQVFHLASEESQMPKEKVGLRILHRLAIHGPHERPKKTPDLIICH